MVRVLGAAENPKFVVVVLVAHGGFGAEAAGPAARDIYQAFFNLKLGSRARPGAMLNEVDDKKKAANCS